MKATGPLDFLLLGPLQVQRDGDSLDLGGAKQHTVLTALVLARMNVVSTDRLIEFVWEGDPPNKPYVTVRSYISHLRRVLEPGRRAGDRAQILVTRSPGYALHIDGDQVDAIAFERHVENARRLCHDERHDEALGELEAGLGLWRSEDLSNSPLAQFGAEADRLLELRSEALGMRVDCMLGLGRHAAVVADLGHQVEAEPLREQPRSQLMLALYRVGRKAEAITIYQEGRRAIVDATGLEPSATLTSLEHRMLAGDPTLAWTASPRRYDQALPVDEPIQIGHPLGRHREWSSAVEVISPPTGDLVVVTGEAGIGKTHLLDQLADRASLLGLAVKWGHCHRGSQTMPLAPWRVLLADLVDDLDDDALKVLVGPRGPDLARLVPEVGHRLGVEPSEGGEPLALFDSIVAFLRRSVSRTPLLICFDDLHWADAASVRLLTFVVAALRGRPVAFAATWRDNEEVADDLASLLGELGRSAGDRRFEFAGLNVAGVAALWASLAGGEIDRAATSRLQKRTGGNPLFITELLRSAPDLADSTPTTTIHDLIDQRLVELPPSCRKLLDICALSPGGFDEALLADLSEQPEEDLLDCIEQLLARRLLVEDPAAPSRFTFSHSLVAESLASQMSGLRRARLHNQIARSGEKRGAPVGELAHHYLEGVAAGEPVVAATAALMAARHCIQLHDHSGAVDLLERALAVLVESDDMRLRARLLVEVAQERKHIEQVPASHEASREAFRLAKDLDDHRLMVQAAMVYCGQGHEGSHGIEWLGYWNPPGPAIEMLEHCLAVLPFGSHRTIALLACSGEFFGEHEDPARAMAMLVEAVEAARKVNDPSLLSAALYHRLTTVDRYLDPTERSSLAEESLTVAREANDPYRELAARRTLLIRGLDNDDLAGARAQATAGLELAEVVGEASLAMMAGSMGTALDLYLGRFDEAEAALGAAMTTYERLGEAALDLCGIQYAVLLRERGRLADLESLLQWKLSGYPGPAYAMALTVVLIDQGKLAEARAVMADYGSSPPVVAGEGILQFSTLAFYAEAVVGLGDVTRAEPLYEEMLSAEGRTVGLFTGLALYGSGSLYLGRLATLLGRYDDADRHLGLAERHHRAVGARPYELRTTLALAALAQLNGNESTEMQLRTGAQRLADELGMGWLLESSGWSTPVERR